MPKNKQQIINDATQSADDGSRNTNGFSNYTWWGKIYAVCFLLGGWLTYEEMGLYENTLIPLYIPLTTWIVCGLLPTPFLFKFINKNVVTDSHNIFVLVLVQTIANMCFFGGVITYVFMYINFTFCKPETVTKTCSVISYRLNSSGNGSPVNRPGYADVMIDGVDKQLFFEPGVPIEKIKSVRLTMNKGYFGYEVITDKVWQE